MRRRISSVLAVSVASAATVGAIASGSAGAGAEGVAAAAGREANIVETATAAGDFKTLTALLKEARLVKALEGKGPYTVFAPTDAAFAKVPKGTLRRLAGDKGKLRSVLLYHVAQGKLRASQVIKRSSVKTLNGQRLRIRVSGRRVFVNGARVTTADVRASNGVIHVINKVLIPR